MVAANCSFQIFRPQGALTNHLLTSTFKTTIVISVTQKETLQVSNIQYLNVYRKHVFQKKVYF